MTVLHNAIHIDASPDKVWSVLTSLDALEHYDPGVTHVDIVSDVKAGPGSARKCDLKPGGWFKERVTTWRPHEELAFELYECTLPVKSLVHRYTLKPEGAGTRVEQHMQYRLKFGPVGALMDFLMVRRQWDLGVKGFFAGLKRYVEKT
jgi:uncharacterized protein YndB with AHSA1/START domain